ncbi:Short chain dehydrogenase-like protein 29 [Elsinoe fawcettii]|nr:Short chain dehydrogenase-like protein 29 [Elsinoe fawcettii]
MDTANALISNLSTKLEKLYPTRDEPLLPSTPFTAIGLLTTSYLTYRAFSFLYTHLRPSSLPKYQHGRPYTTWALITGASDGIGYGFAESLLSRGFNVLLHGRNPSKLSGIQSRLSSLYPAAQIQTVIADASTFSPSDIINIVHVASSLPGPLTVLVNNVGGGPPVADPYASLTDSSYETVETIISMNLRFPVHITRALLPLLRQHQPSLVLNVGSGAGEMGIPYLGVYCGSKAFNLRWSQAMAAEMLAEGVSGVEFTGILIGNVMSGSNKIGDGWFTCSSRTMAERALDKVGLGSNVWGWWRHALQFGFVGMVPEWARVKGVASMMGERKKEYVRLEREKEAAKGTEEAMKK